MLVMSGNMALKLTEIARKTLEEYFKGRNFLPDEYTRSIYNKKQACFVTLTIDGKLRGCIGSLIPQRLWKDVRECNKCSCCYFSFQINRKNYLN